MSLIAKSEGSSNFIPVPNGMHLARCYRIIDLGTQKSEYKGSVRHVRKVMFQFEVHGEDNEGNPLITSRDEPMTASKNYSLTLAEQASLRKDLETWRGKPFTNEETRGFELKNVLGQWAMITVSQVENNGRTFTNIVNVNPVPANIKKAGLPEGHNPLKIFALDEFDQELFDSFSNGLKDKIRLSPEFEALGLSAPSTGTAPGSFDDMADDMPF